MTKEEKDAIKRLRQAGLSYGDISNKLMLPEGTVKSYCWRNNLQKQDEEKNNLCKHCGRPLIQQEKRKAKKFCSDQCRLRWWNSNRDLINQKSAHEKTCVACERAFTSYDAGRKYCSHACYISKRFQKEEV